MAGDVRLWLAFATIVACGDDDAAPDVAHPTVAEGDTTAEIADADIVNVDAVELEAAFPETMDDVVADLVTREVGEPEVSQCAMCAEERRPLVLVHGINGGPENFDVMAARFVADGWPADWVVRFDAADPAWGCNVDNAAAIAELVEATRAKTCQPRVDVVAHSMGTLSSRYYVKNLGGTEFVNTYVTLGGMHHGLSSPCFAPAFLGICVWQELCQSGPFIAQLNAEPSTPGELHWVSIYGTGDKTVPNESSLLEGAENIVIEGAEHDGENGLLQREDVYAEVKRVLGYTCW